MAAPMAAALFLILAEDRPPYTPPKKLVVVYASAIWLKLEGFSERPPVAESICFELLRNWRSRPL